MGWKHRLDMLASFLDMKPIWPIWPNSALFITPLKQANIADEIGRNGPKRKRESIPTEPFSGATVDGSEIQTTTWDV